MLRRLFLLAATVLAASSSAACGGGDSSSASSGAQSATLDKATVKIYSDPNDIIQAINAAGAGCSSYSDHSPTPDNSVSAMDCDEPEIVVVFWNSIRARDYAVDFFTTRQDADFTTACMIVGSPWTVNVGPHPAIAKSLASIVGGDIEC